MKTTFETRKGNSVMIGGVKWKWRAGKENVVMHSEHGERICERIAVVRGLTDNKFITASNRFIRARSWGRPNGMITPACVVKYLKGIASGR